jgi:hypothetical protein
MSQKTVVQGSTKQEVLDQAKQIIARSDPYRQPSMFTPIQRPDGTWFCVITFMGLD